MVDKNPLKPAPLAGQSDINIDIDIDMNIRLGMGMNIGISLGLDIRKPSQPIR